MSNKEQTARTFAEEGLEQITEDTAQAEAAVPVGGVAAVDDGDDGEMQQVGGLEPITLFYRTKPPKKETKQPYKVLAKGDVIKGTYERSFIAGKYKNPTYVIRTTEGKLVGISGTGSLIRAMKKLAEGSKVTITYDGMSVIKGGEWAGSDAHNFTVFGNKLKAS